MRFHLVVEDLKLVYAFLVGLNYWCWKSAGRIEVVFAVKFSQVVFACHIL